MKNKQGISLIVLIVTIIVIIILAAAVILTLNNNNPIDSSRVAQLADNRSSINSALIYIMDRKWLKHKVCMMQAKYLQIQM